MKSLFVTFFVLLFFSIYAFAIQEFEAVVTDKKFNSSSTVVIDEAEIKKSRAKNLTTLLATQANISITQSNFQPNSIYLRGGDSSHVLILVDGVPFYDASSIQRTVNLNTLNLKSIQKIEVIKGSQSVLFGGQALSGVIKITTIPQELKNSGSVVLQAGTQDSRMASAVGTYAFSESQALVLRASVADRNNESPVLDSTKIYPSRNNSVEASYVQKGSDIESIFKVQTSFDKTFIATSDNVTWKAADADNFEFSTYQFSTMGQIKQITSSYKPQLAIAYQKGVRLFEQEDVTKQDYIGDLFLARAEVIAFTTQDVTVITGLSYNNEKTHMINYYPAPSFSDISGDSNYLGIFIKTDWIASERVDIEMGVRSDIQEGKDPIGTYQFGVVFDKSIKAEYSTGFKRPSLYQLYSDSGNLDLQSERSTSTSLSYETNLTPDLFFSITGFQNQFTNLIVSTGSPRKYQNITKTITTGAEMSTGLRFEDQKLNFTVSLGYQEPRDIDAATWLVRRPLRTASFKVRKEFQTWDFSVDVVHNGDRRDQTGPTSYGAVDGYTYVNATAETQVSENVALYLRGQNITNSIYETSHGFYDEGQSYAIGAEASF
ncbi:MAG: hypothetical protein A2622_08895 [Bdellovibrionales bacterium RIFCSPHIGHO2_01_FULL_40_29]|nr:MAG: hypothetical protein A2622_08895 [Bdellovibrionales bacterium RIFCSPHIGHO2_01_FULL_40_29]OFZ32855.1 MAG: hypothetical protein A3D17_09105 [Bdellovibrionales bacterium RIFCSPHIGHO2_02_FULL_40_15]